MIKIQQIGSKSLVGKYNKNETLKILLETFDISNPIFTQFKNPKTFQIELREQGFKICKIDKLENTSDPLYMALTQIRGEWKNERQHSSIILYSEIHKLWFIMIIIGFASGISGSLFYNYELIGVTFVSIIWYLILRQLAQNDLEIFTSYFQELIKTHNK